MLGGGDVLADMLIVDRTYKTHRTDRQTERHDHDILLWVQLEDTACSSAYGRAESLHLHSEWSQSTGLGAQTVHGFTTQMRAELITIS